MGRTLARDQAERLVYTVPEAGRFLGLGRNAAYAAAQRGQIPTIRIGRLVRVPKIPFHRMLGITGTATAAPDEIGDLESERGATGEKGEEA